MVGNQRAGVCRRWNALRAKPSGPAKGPERHPKIERKSVIVRAETDEVWPVLQKERTEFDIAIVRLEHIFGASLHI